MKKIEVSTVKHSDVKGNVQMYLVLTIGDRNQYINIGQKTFDGVNELIKIQTGEKQEVDISSKIQQDVTNDKIKKLAAKEK